MRTILIKNFDNTAIKEYVINGDDAFHLSKVVRVKINDEIQITNGQGDSFKSTVKNILKNEVILSIQSVSKFERPHNISLLCGKPKKNTCEEIIRLGVELGLVHIFFWESEFAQEGIFSEERLQQIIKNSMEQSNNLWLPKIEFIKNLSTDMIKNSHTYVFHNQLEEKPKHINIKLNDQMLIVVGPEGGLSKKDLRELKTIQPKCNFVSLPSPILTTPTAVATSAGYLFSMGG